jgi:hypothetical protein
VTHSDLFAALHSSTASLYAELRAKATTKPACIELYKASHPVETPVTESDIKAATKYKAVYSSNVEHLTADLLKTLDFKALTGNPSELTICSGLLTNISFMSTLLLRNISENQLQLMFRHILSKNKEAMSRQAAFRTAAIQHAADLAAASDTPGAAVHEDTAHSSSASDASSPMSPKAGSSSSGGSVAVRTAIRSVVISGHSREVASQIAASSVVRAMYKDLGIKISFEAPAAAPAHA